jgi:hypothetical protein
MKIRTRIVPESNYHGVFTPKGVTYRYKIDEGRAQSPLKDPELLDISFGTKCYANCPYCYTSAIRNGENYPGIAEKIKRFFEPLNENRPFQVACGGGGEPTLHPEFPKAMQIFSELGIMPNYTTNGMHLTEGVLEATKEFCGGVAISTHKHLKWAKAVDILLSHKIRVNLHVIIGEPGSSEVVKMYYDAFPEIETIVLLPYQAAGRGGIISDQILFDEWSKCANVVNSLNGDRFAFGALFYPFILKNPDLFEDVNVYEPEMFSGYLMLDENPVLRRSSYDLTPR